jgi:hypothetical protein
MKLQLHNITSKINEKKIVSALMYSKIRKAEKNFIAFINYNSNKAFEGEGERVTQSTGNRVNVMTKDVT